LRRRHEGPEGPEAHEGLLLRVACSNKLQVSDRLSRACDATTKIAKAAKLTKGSLVAGRVTQ
jgi:hypothetical protein